MITKSGIDIIKEAAELEEFKTEDLVTDELKASFADCMKSMTFVPKELVSYNTAMVPVFKKDTAYYVEMDSVMKYMDSKQITDVKEAVENIAEANNLYVDDITLVIESSEYMSSVLESAVALSKAGDKSLLQECELSVRLIKLLEAEGLNVALLK